VSLTPVIQIKKGKERIIYYFIVKTCPIKLFVEKNVIFEGFIELLIIISVKIYCFIIIGGKKSSLLSKQWPLQLHSFPLQLQQMKSLQLVLLGN